MHTPVLTVEELLEENRRLRDAHAKELERLQNTGRRRAAMFAMVGLLSSRTAPLTPSQMRPLASTAVELADHLLDVLEDRERT